MDGENDQGGMPHPPVPDNTGTQQEGPIQGESVDQLAESFKKSTLDDAAALDSMISKAAGIRHGYQSQEDPLRSFEIKNPSPHATGDALTRQFSDVLKDAIVQLYEQNRFTKKRIELGLDMVKTDIILSPELRAVIGEEIRKHRSLSDKKDMAKLKMNADNFAASILNLEHQAETHRADCEEHGADHENFGKDLDKKLADFGRDVRDAREADQETITSLKQEIMSLKRDRDADRKTIESLKRDRDADRKIFSSGW